MVVALSSIHDVNSFVFSFPLFFCSSGNFVPITLKQAANSLRVSVNDLPVVASMCVSDYHHGYSMYNFHSNNYSCQSAANLVEISGVSFMYMHVKLNCKTLARVMK